MKDIDQTLPYVKPEYTQYEIMGRIIAEAQQVQRALALELPGQVSVFIFFSASVVLWLIEPLKR